MAIVVLVLWLFTASAGFYLLVTSNLGRARPAATTPAAEPATAPAESATVAGHRIRRRAREPGRSPPRQPQPPPRRRLPRSARCDGRRGTGSIRPR